MTSVLASLPVATPRLDRDPVLTYGRRALPWLMVGLLLGLAAGAGVWRLQPAIANASTVVELTPVSAQVDLGAGGVLQQVTVDTDAQLITSDEVVLAAARAAGRTVAQARAALTVTAAQLTRVLTLTYSDASPKAAQAGAEAAATAFLQARERLVITPVRNSLTRLGNVVDVLPGADPAAAAPAPGTAAADQATPAGRQRAAVAAQLALSGPGVVLQHALALPATDRGSIAVPLGSGAGVGALLLFVIGLLRLRSRRSLSTPPADPAEARLAGRPVPSPVIRRRRRTLRPLACAAALGLVGVAAGLGLASVAADAGPTGSSSFVVRPLAGTAFSARGRDNSVDLLTEAQLVMSDAVLDKVVADPAVIGATNLGLRGHIDAAVLPGSEVITVAVRGGDSGRVLVLARDLARATLQVRQDRALAALVVQRNVLQTRIADSQAALARSTAPGGQAALSPVLSQRLVTLRDLLRAVPTEVDAGGLIDSSSAVPVSRELLNLGIPVLAGLLGGGLGAWLGRHRRPSTARSGPS